MAYSDEALKLLTPKIKMLGRVEDRMSFLYLDQCRIDQTRTGVDAWRSENGELWRTTIPAANLAVLMLGPGTSITVAALTALSRSGTIVLFTSADGLTSYSAGRPLTTSSKWAEAQAQIVTNPTLRRAAAVALYQRRFPDETIPNNTTLRSLRGLEGSLIKRVYATQSRLHKMGNFKRDSQSEDPVNICLNVTNALLYGLAGTVSYALSLNPALGFIHHGNVKALLFDLADVYKAEISIPISFLASKTDDPIPNALRMIREELRKRRTLSDMFTFTQELLAPGLMNRVDDDYLLDDSPNSVKGHTNWAEGK